MLQTLEEIRLALGTPLAKREMIALDVPSTSPAFAIRIEANELMDVWKAARGRVEVTGRWPVAMTTWLEQGPWAKQLAKADLFSRRGG